MSFFSNIAVFLIIILAVGCPQSSKAPQKYTNQDWKYDVGLGKHKKILVASTNNIEDKINPTSEVNRKTGKPINLKIGGVEILSGYINIAKKRYENAFILLDSGHLFSKGGHYSQKMTTIKAISSLPYDGVLLSSREIITADKFSEVKEGLNKVTIPFINSNIKSIKTNEKFKHYGALSYRIIKRSGLNIAILGVTDYKHIKDKDQIKNLFFEDPVLSFLKIKEELKSLKVDITILMANITSDCLVKGKSKEKPGIKRKEFQLECNSTSGVYNLIKRLPPKAIDLVVSSDTKMVEGYVGETPVLQNIGHGKYLSMYEIHWDYKKKKIITDKSNIKSPTALCHNFLKLTEDCSSLESIGDYILENVKEDASFELIEATFLGKQVKRDITIRSSIKAISK